MYEKLIFDINEYIVWLIREYGGAHRDQFGDFCFFLSQQVRAFCDQTCRFSGLTIWILQIKWKKKNVTQSNLYIADTRRTLKEHSEENIQRTPTEHSTASTPRTLREGP